MGLLKFALPFSGTIGGLAMVAMLMNPDTFFNAFDLASVGKEATESALVKHLLFLLAAARIALSALGVASVFYGSETRFRVGLALTFSRALPLPDPRHTSRCTSRALPGPAALPSATPHIVPPHRSTVPMTPNCSVRGRRRL